VIGYSMGAGTTLRLSIQHPGRVRRQVVASASFRSDGVYPAIWEMIGTITPEMFAGSPYEEAYKAVAPHPEHFPILVEKLKDLDSQPFDWSADMPAIGAPTLTIIGDADIVTPEHAVEMLRVLGGGITGDMLDGSPRSQLAILPNTAHQGVATRTELLLAMIPTFLDAPDADTTTLAT
jgi:pimeloyl-ACP methyl ester carboxylesterase